MTLTEVPRRATIDALADVWTSVRQLLGTLDDDQWSAPSPLPGWDVRANVAHLIGTESMLAGIDAPAVDVDRDARPHVRNDIGVFNEAWVLGMADASPAELLDRFTRLTADRLASLENQDDEAWNGESWTPVGRETYGRFMRIRVFDCWMHEQDIRDAVDRPGHDSGPAVDAVLDEISAALGYVVGKRAGAPAGSSVTYRLTGESPRQLHVAVGDKASVVDSLSGAATVTLTMPLGTFTRLCGGRISPADARPDVDADGDADLAARLIDNAAYTI